MEMLKRLHHPDFMLHAAKVYIELLQARRIPSGREISSRATAALWRARHGLFAIRGLCSLLEAAVNLDDDPELHDLRRKALEEVKPALDDITKWLSFAITTSPASYLGEEFGTDCSFMYLTTSIAMSLGVLHENPGSSTSACANQRLMDLLIHIWLMRNAEVNVSSTERGPPSEYFIWLPSGPKGLIDWAAVKGCWLVSTLARIVNSPELSTLFCRRWLARCSMDGFDPSVLFVSTVFSRLDQAVNASTMGQTHLYAAVLNVKALSTLIHCTTVPYLLDPAKEPRWGPELLRSL
jgi:hypothetical protein